jgi:hypothetical protein
MLLVNLTRGAKKWGCDKSRKLAGIFNRENRRMCYARIK